MNDAAHLRPPRTLADPAADGRERTNNQQPSDSTSGSHDNETTGDQMTCDESATDDSQICATPAAVTPCPAPTKPAKSGSRKSKGGNGGAGQRVGLCVGRGAPNQGTVTIRVQRFGQALQRAVEEANGGPATLYQLALIQSARSHERRACYSERWLRRAEEKAPDEATDEKLSLLAAISTAREARDKVLEKLGLQRFGVDDNGDPWTAALNAADKAPGVDSGASGPESAETTDEAA